MLNQRGEKANGDETSILASADPSTHGSAGDTRYVEDKHVEMVHNDGALNYAVEALHGAGLLTTAEADAAAAIATANTNVEITADPAGLTGIEITIDGPATGLFTDRDGWRTGVTDPATDAAVEDIPGSSYLPGADRSVTSWPTPRPAAAGRRPRPVRSG